MPTRWRTVRYRTVRLLGLVLGVAAAGLLGAGQAQAVQPSNWSTQFGGPGNSSALSTSSLKAATVASLRQAWTATLTPTPYLNCGGVSALSYDATMVAAGKTLLYHQGPIVRAYSVETGAVLWTTDSRKNQTDTASSWQIAATPDRVYVYQSPCPNSGVSNGTITALNMKDGSLVNRRSGLSYASGARLGVIGGYVVIPGRVIDAVTLADLWKFPEVDGYASTPRAVSSSVVALQVGGDVLRRMDARRLSDGALLWSITGNSADPVGFSADDSTLFAAIGSTVVAYDPATGAERWRVRSAKFMSASATDVILKRGGNTTAGVNWLERYSLAGVLTASSPAVPQAQSAYTTSVAGKLVLTEAFFSNTTPGISVLQAGTLQPVATLAPTTPIYQAIPVGARVAATTLDSAGYFTNSFIVLA